MFCEAKLDFTDAVITRHTPHIDVGLRIGENLILLARPGTDEPPAAGEQPKLTHRARP